MTGPEHYREAEQLIFDAEHQRLYGEGEAVANNMLARARVHATLALAAAIAMTGLWAPGKGGDDHLDWIQVMSKAAGP